MSAATKNYCVFFFFLVFPQLNQTKMEPAVEPHLSLSATKMTLRSSSSEANTLITCRTLRHLNRLSKSTCSSLESLGRRSSMT